MPTIAADGAVVLQDLTLVDEPLLCCSNAALLRDLQHHQVLEHKGYELSNTGIAMLQ